MIELSHPETSRADPAAIPVTVTEDRVQIGGFGTRFLTTAAAETPEGVGGGALPFALLEHTLAPGLLGAPPHRHSREDEISYVLEGTLCVWHRDGYVIEAGPGTVVRKPRGEWHTFWNADDVPVRFLDVVSPPEFAGYFRELAALIPEQGAPDQARIAALAARYGVEFDFGAIGLILSQYDLHFG